MRFLILNTDYPEFLSWLYEQHPGLENEHFAEQMLVRMEIFFSDADFYSSNLCKLGHEARVIRINNELMQRAWAKDHEIHIKEPAPLAQSWREPLFRARQMVAQTPVRYLKPLFRPILRSIDTKQTWFYKILEAQIKHYEPDILLNQAMNDVSSRFLKKMKPYVRLITGQIASPLPQENFRYYDLIISSLPNYVNFFHKMGIPSEQIRHAFEPRVLGKIKYNEKAKFTLSFVGSLTSDHVARIRFLEYLCQRLPVKVWGRGVENLPRESPIHQHYIGQAWGIDMYRILHKSKITLNYHTNIAGPYANNIRLFEATGVGTLLITDWKVNLQDMFEPNKEVVSYRSPEECVELIQYYLEHDDEREAIARAGQERTLREHTYYHRMKELVDIIQKYL